MSDAPERITAWVTKDGSRIASEKLFPRGVEVEYVRADLIEALQAARDSAWNDALEAAADLIEALESARDSAWNDALEAAAQKAEDHLPKDQWEARDTSAEYNAACRDIAAAIRALKKEATQ